MYKRLLALEEEGMPLRVAVIGCGRFGSMVAAQVLRAPGMDLSVVCDLDVERGFEVLRLSGRDAGDASVTSKVGEANDAVAAGGIVVTGDPGVAVHSEVDVVVEATGNPDAGARHIYEAIMDDRHVVNVTVEADVLVGHLLKGMAVPQSRRLVHRDHGVEIGRTFRVWRRGEHDHQVDALGIELGMIVEGGILERVLPAVRQALLASLDPVHRSQPIASLAVSEAVEEDVELRAEYGAGDELAILLAFHELPVGVDERQRRRGRVLGRRLPVGNDDN